jgi:glyoxylase-like metal-dependent hydrolase (beta-lactamase superfamily II)
MIDAARSMRVFEIRSYLLAFYDGRVAYRVFSEEPNWLDDGAISYGIASFAVIFGDEALVYDTHTSLAHARRVRAELESRGIKRMRVVLSHWHLDHVAGNAAFRDCEIIAHELTLEDLVARKTAIEGGTQEGPPAIDPLILPTTTYSGRMELSVGPVAVELRHADIHSRDGTTIYLPEEKLLLAGDTLEDTVTYVAEPARLTAHLPDLERMATWDIASIYPNHGSAERIGGPGYAPTLITSTQRYVERLLRCPRDEQLAGLALKDFMAEELAAGWIEHFDLYDSVHRGNVASVLGWRRRSTSGLSDTRSTHQLLDAELDRQREIERRRR